MKYDFTCSCGKGIRIVRGDLAQVSCGACQKIVEVPKELRSNLPSEFQSLAAPAAPRKGWLERRFTDQLFYTSCWGVGIAFALLPIVNPSEELSDYRAAKADRSPMRVQEYLNRHSDSTRELELVRLAYLNAVERGDLTLLQEFVRRLGGRPRGYDFDSYSHEAKVWEVVSRAGRAEGYEAYKSLFPDGQHVGEAAQKIAELRGEPTAAPPQPDQPQPPAEEPSTPSAQEERHEPESGMGEDTPSRPAAEEAKRRADEERQALERLRQNKSSGDAFGFLKDDAFAFLEKYPDSSARGEVREIIFNALGDAETNNELTKMLEEKTAPLWNDHTPASTTVRQALSGDDGSVLTVSLSGFTSDDVRASVLDHLKTRMRSLGITLTEVPENGALQVTGSESKDESRTFNKFGLTESGPFAEDFAVTVQLSTSEGAQWSTDLSASTPHSVGYTVYNDVDVGPSQGDVHRATLDALSTQLEELFKYR